MRDLIIFRTPGLIDPRAISTLGASVKEGEHPIGQFGTGLKYAIAIILRAGGEIEIYRGLKRLVFSKVCVAIRNREFDVVAVNGRELGFTTELGKHWAPWMAFREIYCNTIDEGGEHFEGDAAPSFYATEDATMVAVRLAEFAECYRSRGRYFLSAPARYRHRDVSFHEGQRDGVFYRGVRVADDLNGRPFLFAPNVLKTMALTEDRTFASLWDAQRIVASGVLESDDEAFIEAFLTAPEDHSEAHIDLNWSTTPSAAFLKVARRLASDFSRRLNRSALAVLLKHGAMPEIVEAELLASEVEQLREAIAFCGALGFKVEEFPIVISETIDGSVNVLGRADRRARRIYLARRAFQLGDATLAATLIEEWAHIKFEFEDFSREMQNWLFEQVTRLGRAYLFERRLPSRKKELER